MIKYYLLFFDKYGKGYKVVNFSWEAFHLWKELRSKDYELVEKLWEYGPWTICYEVHPPKKSPLCYC